MSKTKIGDTEFGVEAIQDGAEFTIGDSKVQVDSQGQLIGAQAFGNIIECVDGGIKVTRPDGSTMTLDKDGKTTIEDLTPKSIGIKDLAEIELYTVTVSDQSRIHRIDFVNGGNCEVSYTPSGTFSSLSGSNVQQSINKDNEILISQGEKASGTVN